MGVPTYFTLMRIAAIPLFVLVYLMPFHGSHTAAAVIFALASVTDWLDGYLARLLSQVSHFGAFLDPVADKLIVAIALVLLLSSSALPYLALPAMVIIGREIVVSALREWMSEIGKRTSVAVNQIGKIKTLVQMVALVILIAHSAHSPLWLTVLGYLAIYAATLLTFWTMYMYLKAAWPEMVIRQQPTVDAPQ